MFAKPPYEHNIVQVVKLGSSYQVKFLRDLRLSGYDDFSINFGENDDLIPTHFLKEKNHYNYKLSNNISRAITACREYALSNNWSYFATLTIDPQKFNRFDLDSIWSEMAKFFKSINRKYNCHIDYLLVPERHRNNAWHLHGLFYGIPDILISRNDFGYFDFPDYRNKFGFISLDQVKSKTAVSFYITKHLSKQIYNGVFRVGKHLYFHSRGLSRGCIISIIRSSSLPSDFIFQYESEDGSYKSSFFENGDFLKSIGLI